MTWENGGREYNGRNLNLIHWYMEKELEDLAPSKRSAAKTIYETLKILKESNWQLPWKQVIDKIRTRVDFTDWEKWIYEKTGKVRWESIVHFYTINCMKAGYMRKDKGIWYLTEEGEMAISLGPLKLFEEILKRYHNWEVDNKDEKIKKIKDVEEVSELEENKSQIQKAIIDNLEEHAISWIKEFIKNKNPYEFQDMVAALLRAMKYHTPFISPKGKDWWLDIVAYSDPLWATFPRLKVQVKHKPESNVPVDDIRSLAGLLNKDWEIGLFVTSGYFTNESERFARESHKHIKLLDIDSFISLWQEFYSRLTDDDKNILPLHSIYFLGSND